MHSQNIASAALLISARPPPPTLPTPSQPNNPRVCRSCRGLSCRCCCADACCARLGAHGAEMGLLRGHAVYPLGGAPVRTIPSSTTLPPSSIPKLKSVYNMFMAVLSLWMFYDATWKLCRNWAGWLECAGSSPASRPQHLHTLALSPKQRMAGTSRCSGATTSLSCATAWRASTIGSTCPSISSLWTRSFSSWHRSRATLSAGICSSTTTAPQPVSPGLHGVS